VTFESIAIIVVAMGVGAFIKGATGQGLPQIVIPVIATFLGVEAAVVIMAVPGIISNSWLIWNYRSFFSRTRDLPSLLVMGTMGAVLGTILLDSLDPDILALILAGMIALYILVYFLHPSLQLTPAVTRLTSPPVGVAAGVLQGATGVSGPMISTYLHGFRLDKEIYVLSITTVFQVYAVIQTVTLAALGLYTTRLLVLSLLSLAPIMAFLPLGSRVTDRLSRRTFDYVILAVLLGSGLKLVYDGLT
jgi:uncharacterized protein